MALFDNVNYTYYSGTLGRAVIPTADDFDSLKLVNIQEAKKLLPYLEETEENGIDKGVCMMIEADYESNLIKSGASGGVVSSESLGGHSVQYADRAKLAELDTKGTSEKKLDTLRLFCRLNIGVK